MRQVQALEEMDTATTGHDYTYKTYPARWRMLGIVFGFNFVVQIMFTTLMPVATPAADFYGVGLTAINWVSLVWGALFIPGTIFAGWSLFKLGLRLSIILAGAGLLLGSILRTVSAAFPTEQTIRLEDLDGVPNVQKKSLGAYTILLLGTMIMACVQPIILSSTTITAAAWFSEKQRNLAITLVRSRNRVRFLAHALCLHSQSFKDPSCKHRTRGLETSCHGEGGVEPMMLLRVGHPHHCELLPQVHVC
jgi:hypothetical protein